jgi:signal transduction histidine kinase
VLARRHDDGLFGLARRLWAARRGDVRAREELYHLRGVLVFVGVFAATIVLPGMLLAYYGFTGVRARQATARADVARQATAAAQAFTLESGRVFSRFEDAALNRINGEKSVMVGLRELSPALRVVLRFDADGELVAPFTRPRTPPTPPAEVSLFPPLVAAHAAPVAEQPARYAAAARAARDPATRAWALLLQALVLSRERRTAPAAEPLLARLAVDTPEVRDPYGFRVGDLARLRSAELLLARDPAQGTAALRALVESLLDDTWSVGFGAEAAVARRALDVSAGSGASWTEQARIAVYERSETLVETERLLPELDTLGSRMASLGGEAERFRWQPTASAVWAMYPTREALGTYAFALDLEAMLREVDAAQAGLLATPDVRVLLLRPDEAPPSGALTSGTLSPWLPGYGFVVLMRDPGAIDARQAEENARALAIIGLAVVMMVVGVLATVRIVQRELDLARDKADFAAHVSHELRSPITQIRVKAEALQLGLATTPDSVARHHDAIVRESERLSRLVDNMLDFSAIESGAKRYSLRPGDLVGTVARAVEGARVAMETHGMTIDVDAPDDLPPVWHDPDAVAQCMTNLLSNAAKYGAEAGWIGVAVEHGSSEVRVTVADHGIGITPEEQAHVFEQFWRSNDPQARRRKGTGIGLTIVKYVMEAHGGRVSLSSAPGHGAAFTLHFPTGSAADRPVASTGG